MTAAGMSLTVLGALALIVGAARSLVGRSSAPSRQADLAGHASVLRGVVRELSAVGHDRDQNGWNAELVFRTLACSRIVADMAISGNVSRQLADQRAPVAGALALKRRWPSSQTVLVSGSMTPKTLGRELAQPGGRDRAVSIDFEAMHRALTDLTEAAYSDQDTLSSDSLNSSLSTILQQARRLMFEQMWPIRRIAPLIRRSRRPKAS